jgi:hypothetical protein
MLAQESAAWVLIKDFMFGHPWFYLRPSLELSLVSWGSRGTNLRCDGGILKQFANLNIFLCFLGLSWPIVLPLAGDNLDVLWGCLRAVQGLSRSLLARSSSLLKPFCVWCRAMRYLCPIRENRKTGSAWNATRACYTLQSMWFRRAPRIPIHVCVHCSLTHIFISTSACWSQCFCGCFGDSISSVNRPRRWLDFVADQTPSDSKRSQPCPQAK